MFEQEYCELPVVSMGKSGSILANKNEIYQVVPPKVEKKSVPLVLEIDGSGISVGLVKRRATEIRVGIWSCIWYCSDNESGTELCRKEDLEKLFNRIHTS